MDSQPSERLTAVVDNGDALRPFLPLLYAAWADGELSTAELRDLDEAIERAADLRPECRRAVHDWLDAERPPTAEDLALLASHIRHHLEPLREVPLGPADLGLRLTGALDPGIAAALAEADRAVGPFEPVAGAGILRFVEPEAVALAPLPDPGEPRFDAAELGRLLDGPHGEVKARLRSVLSRPEFALEPCDSLAQERDRVRGWLAVLADEGFGGLAFPPELGGGGDPGGFTAAFQTLAHHDLSLVTKFGVQYGLFCGAVFRLGTDHHHRQVLPGALSLAIPGCFAMTESGHGSNVAALETTATFDPESDEFVIDTPTDMARKDYIGNAAEDGRLAVVFARLLVGDLDHGVHALLAPIRSPSGQPMPGVRIEDNGPKGGLNGVDNGRIWFDGVRVPRSMLLDRFASIDATGHYESSIASPARRFFTTLGTLVGGRISVGAAGISSAETALTIAIRYATRRRQFGAVPGAETPLIEYPAHQRRLLPRLAATYAYHFALADLAVEYVAAESAPGDTDVDRRRLEARAAGLKAYATWHALDTTGEARQACGGQGYMSENRLTAIRADVDVLTTYEGDNTVLAQLLAKALLTGHRSSFDDLTPARLVRFVRSWIETAITEAVPRLGSVGGDLTTAESQAELLRRRADHTLETLARRIRNRIDGGTQAADALVEVQPHALHAARAHAELWAHESMGAAAERAADPFLADILGRIRTLAALWHTENDLGWFLEHGILTPAGAGRVRALVTSLSAELARDSRHLVDAFGIPDQVLAAPIAL